LEIIYFENLLIYILYEEDIGREFQVSKIESKIE
jgi:hypothetical protein